MKKIYIAFFAFVAIFMYSQPYSSLLQNTNWTITKIRWTGVDYYPPEPFMQSGKVAFNFDNNNGFKSSFFNVAGGNVFFAPNNNPSFTVQNMTVTLADYFGFNEQLVRDFDYMTTNFYAGVASSDSFYFEYEQVFSGKNLIVTNKYGNKIFYSNLILGSYENALNKTITIYPNPVQKEFFIKPSQSTLDKVDVEIFDSSGKLVYKKHLTPRNPINVETLSNGIYEVKIKDVKAQYSAKLLIRK